MEMGRVMRPEARDQFLVNADATARALGGTSIQDGVALVRRILAKLTEMFESIQTPEQLAAGLDDLNVTPEIESLMIQGVAAGPLLLRWMAMKANESAETNLPTFPNRRPPVPAKVQVEIVKFVNDLNFRQNVPLEAAKRRAAKKFDCGVRTIERYWKERENILANGPKYHFDDLLNGILGALKADFETDATARRP
jgi:hypothetical protein